MKRRISRMPERNLSPGHRQTDAPNARLILKDESMFCLFTFIFTVSTIITQEGTKETMKNMCFKIISEIGDRETSLVFPKLHLPFPSSLSSPVLFLPLLPALASKI